MRLAEQIVFSLGDRTVLLLPSLRGALRVARDFGGFGPVLSGVRDGSLTVLSRVIREGVSSSLDPLPDPLFKAGEKPLYQQIAELQAPAFALVMGWMGHDPDAVERPTGPRTAVTNPVEEFEAMFGFATGILRWTPSEAWAATPREIIVAANARAKAYGASDDGKAEPDHSTLTLDQQAMRLSARLDLRAS